MVGRGSKRLAAAGKAKVRIVFTRKAKQKLRRLRAVKLTIVMTARDDAGNVSGAVTRKLTLRR